jgi:hypothetical protein
VVKLTQAVGFRAAMQWLKEASLVLLLAFYCGAIFAPTILLEKIYQSRAVGAGGEGRVLAVN